MRSGKVWGETVSVVQNPYCEMHHVRRFEAGKQCSKHTHQFKWNLFLVISGRLMIRAWQPSGTVDDTILGPGDYTQIAPNVPHRFIGLEDGEMIELYWPEFNHADIRREDVGGQTFYEGPIDA